MDEVHGADSTSTATPTDTRDLPTRSRPLFLADQGDRRDQGALVRQRAFPSPSREPDEVVRRKAAIMVDHVQEVQGYWNAVRTWASILRQHEAGRKLVSPQRRIEGGPDAVPPQPVDHGARGDDRDVPSCGTPEPHRPHQSTPRLSPPPPSLLPHLATLSRLGATVHESHDMASPPRTPSGGEGSPSPRVPMQEHHPLLHVAEHRFTFGVDVPDLHHPTHDSGYRDGRGEHPSPTRGHLSPARSGRSPSAEGRNAMLGASTTDTPPRGHTAERLWKGPHSTSVSPARHREPSPSSTHTQTLAEEGVSTPSTSRSRSASTDGAKRHSAGSGSALQAGQSSLRRVVSLQPSLLQTGVGGRRPEHLHKDGEGALRGTRPLGEGTRPLGEGTRPLGEGTRPLGEGTRPLGEGTRPHDDKASKAISRHTPEPSPPSSPQPTAPRTCTPSPPSSTSRSPSPRPPPTPPAGYLGEGSHSLSGLASHTIPHDEDHEHSSLELHDPLHWDVDIPVGVHRREVPLPPHTVSSESRSVSPPRTPARRAMRAGSVGNRVHLVPRDAPPVHRGVGTDDFPLQQASDDQSSQHVLRKSTGEAGPGEGSGPPTPSRSQSGGQSADPTREIPAVERGAAVQEGLVPRIPHGELLEGDRRAQLEGHGEGVPTGGGVVLAEGGGSLAVPSLGVWEGREEGVVLRGTEATLLDVVGMQTVRAREETAAQAQQQAGTEVRVVRLRREEQQTVPRGRGDFVEMVSVSPPRVRSQGVHDAAVEEHTRKTSPSRLFHSVRSESSLLQLLPSTPLMKERRNQGDGAEGRASPSHLQALSESWSPTLAMVRSTPRLVGETAPPLSRPVTPEVFGPRSPPPSLTASAAPVLVTSPLSATSPHLSPPRRSEGVLFPCEASSPHLATLHSFFVKWRFFVSCRAIRGDRRRLLGWTCASRWTMLAAWVGLNGAVYFGKWRRRAEMGRADRVAHRLAAVRHRAAQLLSAQAASKLLSRYFGLWGKAVPVPSVRRSSTGSTSSAAGRDDVWQEQLREHQRNMAGQLAARTEQSSARRAFTLWIGAVARRSSSRVREQECMLHLSQREGVVRAVTTAETVAQRTCLRRYYAKWVCYHALHEAVASRKLLQEAFGALSAFAAHRGVLRERVHRLTAHTLASEARRVYRVWWEYAVRQKRRRALVSYLRSSSVTMLLRERYTTWRSYTTARCTKRQMRRAMTVALVEGCGRQLLQRYFRRLVELVRRCELRRAVQATESRVAVVLASFSTGGLLHRYYSLWGVFVARRRRWRTIAYAETALSTRRLVAQAYRTWERHSKLRRALRCRVAMLMGKSLNGLRREVFDTLRRFSQRQLRVRRMAQQHQRFILCVCYFRLLRHTTTRRWQRCFAGKSAAWSNAEVVRHYYLRWRHAVQRRRVLSTAFDRVLLGVRSQCLARGFSALALHRQRRQRCRLLVGRVRREVLREHFQRWASFPLLAQARLLRSKAACSGGVAAHGALLRAYYDRLVAYKCLSRTRRASAAFAAVSSSRVQLHTAFRRLWLHLVAKRWQKSALTLLSRMHSRAMLLRWYMTWRGRTTLRKAQDTTAERLNREHLQRSVRRCFSRWKGQSRALRAAQMQDDAIAGAVLAEQAAELRQRRRVQRSGCRSLQRQAAVDLLRTAWHRLWGYKKAAEEHRREQHLAAYNSTKIAYLIAHRAYHRLDLHRIHQRMYRTLLATHRTRQLSKAFRTMERCWRTNQLTYRDALLLLQQGYMRWIRWSQKRGWQRRQLAMSTARAMVSVALASFRRLRDFAHRRVRRRKREAQLEQVREESCALALRWNGTRLVARYYARLNRFAVLARHSRWVVWTRKSAVASLVGASDRAVLLWAYLQWLRFVASSQSAEQVKALQDAIRSTTSFYDSWLHKTQDASAKLGVAASRCLMRRRNAATALRCLWAWRVLVLRGRIERAKGRLDDAVSNTCSVLGSPKMEAVLRTPRARGAPVSRSSPASEVLALRLPPSPAPSI